VGCPFQYDEVGYDWEKGMTFWRVWLFFWGRVSCCNKIGWSAPMSWRTAEIRSLGGDMIGFVGFRR